MNLLSFSSASLRGSPTISDNSPLHCIAKETERRGVVCMLKVMRGGWISPSLLPDPNSLP